MNSEIRASISSVSQLPDVVFAETDVAAGDEALQHVPVLDRKARRGSGLGARDRVRGAIRFDEDELAELDARNGFKPTALDDAARDQTHLEFPQAPRGGDYTELCRGFEWPRVRQVTGW